ncbi:MAG TPA: nucleoside-diphosphate sugar epimerase/dehydratase [Candidatus Thermoplasmatota archaeon]|nr:nucleoside-diphosphate sugar epimerase/dehydratase [Candidatus Thermoplasmatota archaeon]
MDDERAPFAIRITSARRIAFFAVVDAFLVGASILLATALRFDGLPPRDQLEVLPLIGVLAVAGAIATLAALGVYRLSWVHIGLRDIARVAVAVVVSTALVSIAALVTHETTALPPFPRSIVLIQAPITFCALAGFRLSKRAYRLARGRRTASASGVPTLLVGAGDAGAQVLKSIQLTGAPYDVRGFVDDDELARGTLIHGVRVLAPVSRLEDVARRERAEAVIICVANAPSHFLQDVVHRARSAGIRTIRIVPSLHEIIGGTVSIESTRQVSLEDLLGRETVAIDQKQVRDLLAGRRVLVTGGAGTIGAELCRQVARFAPAALTILDIDESRLHDLAVDLRNAYPRLHVDEALVDVRDKIALEKAFERARPEIVYHAAAYKHVPMMEKYPLSALAVNVAGTVNVAEAAEAAGARRLILISTDKAVEPSSVMGASKRIAELEFFASQRAGGMIRSAVRFGNVIGSRGSVIPTFRRQLEAGGPLTVTHPDIERFFMMTSEAVSLVLQASVFGEGGDVFVLDMGKPIRILDVARDFLRLSGRDEDVEITFIGLRPGEKLYEVLRYDHEAPVPTPHPRILRVLASKAGAESYLPEVESLLASRDEAEARRFLQVLFPSLLVDWSRQSPPPQTSVTSSAS